MAAQDDASSSKLFSTRNKILIATVAGVSVGILSYFLWNRKDSKVQEIVWSDLNVSQIDDTQPLEIKEPKLPENCEFVTVTDLKNMLQTQSHSDCTIIDVRDKTDDYSGGHVKHSINISHQQFYDSIPDIVNKYNNKSQIVICCMYGARRSVKCIEFLSKAISEIIENYSKETSKSHYFMYHVKTRQPRLGQQDGKVELNDNLVEQAQLEDDSSIHLLYDGKYGWMDENVVKKKIDINCNDKLIKNLQKQQLNVLKGGFFAFLNDLMDSKRDNIINMMEDFQEDKYEMLELRGLFDKKMWYHKNEYFAKSKFIQLKAADKSARFKLNSSTKDMKHNKLRGGVNQVIRMGRYTYVSNDKNTTPMKQQSMP
eukprot:12059_1